MLRIFFCCLLAANSCLLPAISADFTVSPKGNDAWSGKAGDPTADGKDGPFATLAKARDAARELRKQDAARKTPIVIELRGGSYYLPETLVLGPEDSGTPESPLIFSAHENETPIVSSGTPITNWKVENGRWVTELPTVKANQWNFMQLFVNDERRFRPRLPRDTYFKIAGRIVPPVPTDPKAKPAADDRFRFKEGQFNKAWSNLSDIEVITFHPWFLSFLRIKAIEDKTVIFTGSTRTPAYYGQLNRDMRYVIDNVKEALEVSGEWYLDRPTGMLTYIPKAGETPEKSVVVAPRLNRCVELKADVKGPYVENIQFKGIAFEHSNWVTPAESDSQTQAAVKTPGALYGKGARNIEVLGCTFSHLGTYGAEFEAACKKVRIEGCRFTDIGAGGIKIGTTGFSGDPNTTASDILVRDNQIAHVCRIHAGAIGVWIGHAFNCTVEHNDIYDLYYTGVSVGWSWGYGKTGNHDNVIANNHIHHVGQEVLSDMGGIYTLGLAPGSINRGNVIHDVYRDNYGGWGIYYDEGSSGWLSENNLIYRTEDGGFNQHYGQNNIFSNNIIAFAREAQYASPRLETNDKTHEWQKQTAYTFEKNIVLGWGQESPMRNWSAGFTDKKTEAGGMFSVLQNNLYWNDGKPFKFVGNTLEDFQKKNYEMGTVVADPKFEDAAHDNFTLKADSPALALGFKPFDYSKAGRLKNELNDLDLQRWPRCYPPKPPTLPAMIADTFEDTPVGQPADSAHTSEENNEATVRVTDTTAFEGKRSLMFKDGPGQKQIWNPHVYWNQYFKTGTLRGSFALRVEKGALVSHEWRTNGHPYKVGPTLRVENGTIYSRDKMIGELAPGQWAVFEFVTRVGDKADGKYDLTCTIQGQQPQVFKDLPCDPEFKNLGWFGFTANAKEAAVFYLDAVSVKAE